MTAILKITDGTTEINLLNLPGYQLNAWRPSVADYKGGGTFRQSALSDGRRLVDRQFTNIIDTFDFKMRQDSQDNAYYDLQELHRMLEKAADYWASSWPTQYVYLIAQATNETNPRYAIIQVGRIPEFENPYAQPFLQPDCVAVMNNMTLIIEHGHWLDNPIEDASCLEIGATQPWCSAYPLVFDGADSYVDLASPAVLDDLPSADFTIDAWIYPTGYGENNAGRIFDKSSWFLTLNNTVGLRVFADYLGQDAESQSLLADLTLDEWHHVAAVWDQATATFTLYLDGVDVTNFQQAAIGAYVSDAAQTAYIGSNGGPGTNTFDGSIGWLRISTAELWTAEFTPPARCPLPSLLASTAWLGIYEGTPASPGAGDIHDLSVNGNDGTGSDVIWDDCCETNYGNYFPCSPRYMTFNGLSSLVNCGSAASLDNLPSTSDFTFETWIRANSFGQNNAGGIVSKNDVLIVYLVNFGGVAAFAGHAATNAFTWTNGDLFSPDGEWHHVAVVWDLSRLIFDIFIDGQRATYGGQQAAVGAYNGDAAGNLFLGNWVFQNRSTDGDIGWSRLSSYRRYTTGFTPPARCTVPVDDTNTISIWNYLDDSTIYDFAFSGNDGTPTDIENGCDCVTPAREETCSADTVYVANKHNLAQLTHIFIEDGGVFGANLLTQALPQPLLPATPTNGGANADRIYFGIDTDADDSGPFCSLVFDLQSAQAGIADIVWEYWNGAWVALTVQDNTDADGAMTGAAFDTTGVKSVHWEQPSAWVTTTVNGITGYWVRAEVQDAGTAPPVQQNRHIYSVLWPYIEVQTDKVGGDIPALIRQYIRNQSDNDLTNTPILFSDRVIAGLRTVDRGEDFSAYINFAQEQNPPGITVFDISATFTADVQTPTGWKIRSLVGGTVALVQFDATISRQYYGKFHVFSRMYQATGSPGDESVQLFGGLGVSGLTAQRELSDEIALQTTSDWELVDFGKITFPFSPSLSPSETGTVILFINASGNATLDLYDLILMPVDEWTLDTADVELTSPVATGIGYRRDPADRNAYLDVDSVSWPKNKAKTLLKGWADGLLDNVYRPIINGAAVAQANATQRYWFVHTDTSDNPERGSRFEIVNSLQMFRLQRYLSARGAR